MACDQLALLCPTHVGVTYISGSRRDDAVHSFIQQIFIEHLLCARLVLCTWDTLVNKTGQNVFPFIARGRTGGTDSTRHTQYINGVIKLIRR